MKLDPHKLELIVSWATLHFVGWVESTPGLVGFRCTQPNLHVAGVIAKCETQQRPISEPSPKVSFSIRLAFFGPATVLTPETYINYRRASCPSWASFSERRLVKKLGSLSDL